MKTFLLVSVVAFVCLFVCCFRFCSDTFGKDPPLNAPKLLVGAKLTFVGCETTYNNNRQQFERFLFSSTCYLCFFLSNSNIGQPDKEKNASQK